MNSTIKLKSSLGRRVLRELREFTILTAYFYVAFVTVILFKATVLHYYGIYYVVWGAAIVKALLIAKFMLIGRGMKIGEGYLNGPLIKPILHKVFGFLVLLLVLASAEEVATGLIHHRSVFATFHEFGGARLGETLTEILVLLLVLAPLVAFSVFGEALGEGNLRKMLFRGDMPPAR